MGFAAQILGLQNFLGLIFKIKPDIVKIEESVREPFVPILPGVQPRRRFYFNLVVDGGWSSFWFFKSNEIFIYIYIYMGIYIYIQRNAI